MLINLKTFLNLSNPKPIIIAANVPPKTIKIDERRNSARNEPPSKKKPPKMEKSPRSNPNMVPPFFIICIVILIFAFVVIIVCKTSEASNPDSVNQLPILAD